MKKKVVGFVATVAMVMMMCTSVFAFDTYEVMGGFNGWGEPGIAMSDADGDGIWEAVIDIAEATDKLEVKVRADSDWNSAWGAAKDDGVTNAPGGDNVVLENVAAGSRVKVTINTTGEDETKWVVTAALVTDEAGASAGDGSGAGTGDAGPNTGDTVPFAAVAAIVAMLAMGYSAVALKKTR